MTGGLDYNTLLKVYMDHTSVVNTLWSILQVVSVALLGFVYQQEHLRRNWLALSALSAAFIVFSFGNQAAMTRSQQVLVAVVDQMHDNQLLSKVPVNSGVIPVLQAHEARPVKKMHYDHFFLSAGVVLLVWLPFVTGRLKDRRAVKKKAGAP